LIIGGRFGGTYVRDEEKSITNAEYEAAKTANIPVFTYVRNTVLSSHHTYRQNKGKPFISEIDFPGIEKQPDAEKIFKFIDEVRRASVNNAFEGFSNFNEIDGHLRKQWAGMFFDFLKNREVKLNIDATNHLLSGLRASNDKLEDLVKSLYRSTALNGGTVESDIQNIEVIANVKAFYRELFLLDDPALRTIVDSELSGKADLLAIADTTPVPGDVISYLLASGAFYLHDFEDGDVYVMCSYGDFGFEKRDLPRKIVSLYNSGIVPSTKEQRVEALMEIFEIE